MTTIVDNVPPVERLRSAVPGLHTILGGGFFRSDVYIIQGLPGCGKTILANQVCYGHIAQGGAAVYVTLLAESHSRMIQHLSTLSFFDVKAFPDKLAYISAFHDLESNGLKGLMTVLRREMRTRRVGVLVLDGLVAASEAAPTDLDLKKFIHELQSIAVLQDVDGPDRGFGAFWGEVQTNIHQALGCLGVITDGCIRDIPAWAPGFQALAGSIVWSDKELGWIADWRLAANGATYRWQVRGVNFDEAFRVAIRGAAQILSGNGQP